MGIYLAFKEVYRNRTRFLLFSLVIALITVLVLFIAALAEGLSSANRQYLENLDADLLAYQENVDLSANSSQIVRSKVNSIERIKGVRQIGSIGFGSAKIAQSAGSEDINISLIGIEAGRPGSPLVLFGQEVLNTRGRDAVIDQQVAADAGLKVGEIFTIKTIQGTEEKLYELRVVGISPEKKYLYQSSVFVPFRFWNEVRPQPAAGRQNQELVTSIVAVKLDPSEDKDDMALRIEQQVAGLEVVDLKTAYEAIPGYKEQQNTLNTQQGFTLLIGILVVGGFFQIQMLQKIPQIGVLKAIGVSNMNVAVAVVTQIILVTTFGVTLGTLATLGLSIGIPNNVPVSFNGTSVIIAVISLLLIGPIGGLVSVRLAVRVEPLTALGLSS